jgi:hypothetical protein
MLSIIRKSVVFSGAFLLLAGATANAGETNMLKVKVPFAFVVGARNFPAGEYAIERDDLSSSLLLIRGEKLHAPAAFVTTELAGGKDPAGTAPVLTFTRDEGHYRLSSVWESGNQGWIIAR